MYSLLCVRPKLFPEKRNPAVSAGCEREAKKSAIFSLPFHTRQRQRDISIGEIFRFSFIRYPFTTIIGFRRATSRARPALWTTFTIFCASLSAAGASSVSRFLL